MIYTNYKYYLYLIIFSLFSSNLVSQSMQELLNAKKEYEKYKTEGRRSSNNTLESSGDLNESAFQAPSKITLKTYNSLKKSDSTFFQISRFYGYDFFLKKDSISFWENLPSPPNYILGPGDEIIVSLWGQTQLRKNYLISRNGKIFDERVGIINISGKNLEESKNYLKTQFGRVYSTIKGSNPSTFIDVSLGELRSINVGFVGEVNSPGVYPVHPFSNLITGLIQIGGVDTTGTLRNIKLIRNNEIINTVDLYDYFLKGRISKNIQLRDQDIIFVGTRLSKILVDSAVVRPSYYESLPGETIKDMIDYAGGPSFDASNRIVISKILPLEDKKLNSSRYENYYIDFSYAHEKLVGNSDIIIVLKELEEIKQVEISGQVKRPGFYKFYSGMTLADLLDISSGFNDLSFLKTVYQKRGQLIRHEPKSKYEKVIEFDLENIIKKNNSSNLVLQNEDKVVIHADPNYFDKENILILGEVNIPGGYPQLKDLETLNSFINRAGGFTSKASTDGIEIFRDTTRVAWENMDIPLSPGDSVIINKKPGAVLVEGEVYNQGLLEFQKGKSLNYYINSAGGITNLGNKKDILVILPNGVVAPKRFLRTTEIKDGSKIVVNAKEISEPFQVTEFATNIVSLISSVVTVAILAKQLEN